MNIFKKNLPIIGIFLFCLLIISIWFKDGKLLATGEDSLILVNPDRAIEIYKHSWQEIVSGEASPGWIARIPLLFIESLTLKMGMQVWLFQAILFFLLMFIGATSTYYLSKELLKKYVDKKSEILVGGIAALFYILNPVSLLTIWDRGIAVYSFIFFYALAPLFFYLYFLGINKRKASFIIVAPFITLFFSSAFASAAEPFLLWVLPFIYSITTIFVNPAGVRIKFRFFPVAYFLTSFIYWVLISLWWIFPWVGFANTEFFSQDNILEYSINTLKANSKDFTLDNVIRLIHGGFLFRSEAFGPIYKSLIFLIFSWLIPIFTVYGLIKLRRSQIKLFFVFSLAILLFAAKGTSFPLGEIFLWSFIHISILQIFRNSFEKIGMLLPTLYAPLFSLGLYYLLFKYRGRRIRVYILVLALICLMIYSWPFFTGALIHYGSRDIRVEVPSSFKEANQAIPNGNHIILSVPIMGGSSGLYKWQYGFKGLEAGQYLFNYPVVTSLYYPDTFYGQLLTGMSNGYLNNLVGLAQLFSADIIAYRKDTDVKAFGYNFDALERFEKMIRDANLNKIFDSQYVSLWVLPGEKIAPVVYIPNSIRFGESPKELISLLEDKQFDPKQETFICINKNTCKPYLKLPDKSSLQINKVPEKIEVNKISPVIYKIKVYNSRGRFLVVFNNTYHPGWNVSVGNKLFPPERHIIANGYANGFIIDQLGNFEISLRFAPEEDLKRFYKISLIVVSLGIFLLFPLLIFESKR